MANSSLGFTAAENHRADRLRLELNKQPALLHALVLHDHLKRLTQDDRATMPLNAVDAPLRVVEIDSGGLKLSFSPLGASKPDLIRIPFTVSERPTTASDISLAIAMLRSEARESLLSDVPASPRLQAFTTPPLFPELFIVLVLLAFQLATAISSESSPLPFLRRLAVFRDGGYLPGGRTTVRYSYVFLVVAHLVEAVWFKSKLKREKTVAEGDIHKWFWWTIAFGLAPMRPHYLRSLERERIRLIYVRAAGKGLAVGDGKASSTPSAAQMTKSSAKTK